MLNLTLPWQCRGNYFVDAYGKMQLFALATTLANFGQEWRAVIRAHPRIRLLYMLRIGRYRFEECLTANCLYC